MSPRTTDDIGEQKQTCYTIGSTLCFHRPTADDAGFSCKASGQTSAFTLMHVAGVGELP
jgi:hypothetical protein